MLKRLRASLSDPFWSTNLLILVAVVFLERFGQGIVNAVNTNFFVDTLRLSGAEVLWLAGFREIPGLGMMFFAALIMHLPLVRRAMLSLILMGIGYGLCFCGIVYRCRGHGHCRQPRISQLGAGGAGYGDGPGFQGPLG
jgi:hypothetical protein